MDKLDKPLFGDLKPDETVDLYFNLSSDGNPANDQPAPWIKRLRSSSTSPTRWPSPRSPAPLPKKG